MKKTLFLAMCLMAGFLLGTSFSDWQCNLTTIEPKSLTSEKNSTQIDFYDNMIQDANTIEIYETSELNHEVMANRNGKIIVEKIIGEVTNYKLDGKILNCNEDDGGYTNKDGGNYINYERVDGAQEGDKILTYFIYNPFTNTQDDVLTRLDFIIDDNPI